MSDRNSCFQKCRFKREAASDQKAHKIILPELFNVATFCDGKKYQVTEKKSDANLELTIYAVKESQLEEKTEKSIRLAALGSSYEVKKGDTTVLLGMLFGQGDAVGYGVLRSSTEKAERADGTYHILGAELAGFTGGSGIMFNRQEEVIGIICDAAGEDAKEELMHAYAISDIKDVMQFLANGESVPYIGIHATDVSENIAEDRRIPRGIYVDKVEGRLYNNEELQGEE